MAPNLQNDSPQKVEEPGSKLLDVRHHAHRVLRERKGADRFNPFRHIPWDTKHPNDIEARSPVTPPIEPKVFRFWRFKYKCCIPEVPFTVSNQFKRTFLTSWINIFLICVPIGLYLSIRGKSAGTFVVNFVAEIPLWFMCDYALEEMEYYIGMITGDLLDIFTTNTVQVISSIILLKTKQVSLLQTSLVGGILSNILMLLGLSLLSGGMPNHEQKFNRTGAQGSSSLLSIAATSLLIPTVVKQLGQTTQENLVLQSRGVAFVLLFVYITYTFCQMVTHKKEYQKSGKSNNHETSNPSQGNLCRLVPSPNGHPPDQSVKPGHLPSSPSSVGSQNVPKLIRPVRGATEPEEDQRNSRNEVKPPHLHFGVATAVFAVTIVLLFFCVNATVDSISALTEHRLSQTFVGLILLPIPNCDFAPISMAFDDDLEPTMRYTVGRSIQTALLVEPMVVLLAWWTGVSDVTLAFDGFEVVSLFTTVLLLNFLVVDAKTHWVHGVLLLADWVLIGIAAYFVTPEA